MESTVQANTRDVLIRHGLYNADASIALAFSGGSDSSALFHALLALQKDVPFKLVALHVNYHLREDDSESDQLFVSALCENTKTPVYIKSVPQEEFENKNVQIHAREIRYRYFKEMKEKLSLDAICLAHHERDQVETTLYRLLKGAGGEGAGGMKEKNGYYYRPLLSVSKDAIERYLKEHAIAYREDRSNNEPKYLRNRIRNELLPVIRNIVPDAESHIRIFAEIAQGQAGIVKKALSYLTKKTKLSQNENELVYDLPLLLAFPRELRLEFIRALFIRLEIAPSYRRIMELEKLLASPKPTLSVRYADGTTIRKAYDVLWVTAFEPGARPYEILIPDEGVYAIEGAGEFAVTILKRGNEPLRSRAIILDADKIQFPLTLRSRRAADTIRAFPDGRQKRLKRILIDKKVPRDKRDAVPALIDKNGTILAFGLGLTLNDAWNVIALEAAVTERTKTILRIAPNRALN